jgi:hypothetical protein
VWAQEFIKELHKHHIESADVAAGRDSAGVGQYLRSLPLAARVNDWFFAHAGDTGGRTLKVLRSDLEAEVDAKGYDADILLGKHGLLEARLRFTANGTPYTLQVPDYVITLSPSTGAADASTVFDAGQNAWVTNLPSSFTGNGFLSGTAFNVSTTLPGGINPVTWKADFSTPPYLGRNKAIEEMTVLRARSWI